MSNYRSPKIIIKCLQPTNDVVKSYITLVKFTCELTWIEIPNKQPLGSKLARCDHLAWLEDPPCLKELYSVR